MKGPRAHARRHRLVVVAVVLVSTAVAAGAMAVASLGSTSGAQGQLVQHTFTSGAVSAQDGDTARMTFVNGLDNDLTIDIYILDGDGAVLAESKGTPVPASTTGSLDFVLNKAAGVHGKVVLTGSPKINCNIIRSVLEVEGGSGIKVIDNWGHVHLKVK